MESLSSALLPLAQQGYIPDFLLRFGIRSLLQSTLSECRSIPMNNNDQLFAQDLIRRPNIAEATDVANKQHYEVSYEFYRLMLGPRFKYSSCLYQSPTTTLQEAEETMLNLTCERAEISNIDNINNKPITILDLGCGWGSLTLWILSKYPNLNLHITCVSNSSSQREFILQQAKQLGIDDHRLTAITCNVNVLEFPASSFDRVISIEMFEHMKNYQILLNRIAKWLKPDTGKLFVHIFTHKHHSYHFEKGWMAETFFTGGTMPSQNLLSQFDQDLIIERQWHVNGKHYSRTLEDWLKRLDHNKNLVLPELTKIYGAGKEQEWFMNWRLFNLACSELFNYNDGEEWFVTHYLFRTRKG
jgi:cyclopropane-fatty-acyl-phospholipid synthase